jgi:trehalose 6-phosphate synthase/phosphatase
MISGIRSLSATHEQLIIGWTGDIETNTPGERVPMNSISQEDKYSLQDALATYTPREADPDDDKKTHYVPVWLDDKVAHGHYDGYCKTSEFIFKVAYLLWRHA